MTRFINRTTLKETRCIVFGAAGALGSAMAIQLAQAGAKTIILVDVAVGGSLTVMQEIERRLCGTISQEHSMDTESVSDECRTDDTPELLSPGSCLLDDRRSEEGKCVTSFELSDMTMNKLQLHLIGVELEGYVALESIQVFAYRMDITNEAAVQQGIHHFMGIDFRSNTPDIIVNCVGVGSVGNVMDVSSVELRRVYEVNVFGNYYLAQALLPYLLKSKSDSTYVVLSSFLGLCPCANSSLYSTSKFAVVGFCENLRQDIQLLRTEKIREQLKMSPDDTRVAEIRVLCVCPGLLDAPMFKNVLLKPMGKWLMPLVPPDEMATQVLRSIEKQHDYLIYPRILVLLALIRCIVPCFIFDWIQELSGANQSMIHAVSSSQCQKTPS